MRTRRLTYPALLVLGVILAVFLVPRSWPPVPPVPAVPPAPATAGLVGPVGPTARACQGVLVNPGDNLQRSIDSHPGGTVFCLAEGTHRLEIPVVPKQGDALIGRLGAVLSGSVVVAGWRRDQDAWSSTGSRDPFGDVGGLRCVRGTTTCDDTQDVFLDKTRLRRVQRRAEVTAGTVYIDRRTNVITIGDDPGSHLIEQAVAAGLVRGAAGDVTVANLVLEQAANPAQTGVIESRRSQTGSSAGTGWRILDNEVRFNHGVGLGFAGGALVSGNLVHHQGQLGMAPAGRGSTITNNEISFNNTAGYSMEWEAGGLKAWRVESTTMTHNYVHDNVGPGLWSDGGNAGMAIEYNKVADNWAGGIEYEISYDAVIGHNEVTGNGRRHKGWAWDAGIEIASSGGAGRIEVRDNVLVGNANGITLIDSRGRSLERPTPYGPHTVQNIWVHGNTVTLRAGEYTGAVEDRLVSGVFTTGNNRFDANTYVLDSPTQPHFLWSGDRIGWDRWRGNGHDPAGRTLAMGR